MSDYRMCGLMLAGLLVAGPSDPQRAPNAGGGAARLQQVAKALGSDGAPIQRIEASGELRTYVGEGVYRHDISVVLDVPGSYVQRRVLTFPPAISTEGFDGDRLIRELRSTTPTMTAGVHPLSADAERLQLESRRLEATRLLVAWTMSDRAPVAIRYEYGGEAQVGATSADVFTVMAGDTAVATVYADRRTAIPIGLSFPRADRGTSRSGPATSRPPSETRWTLGGYKTISGLLFPHTLLVADDGKVREEWHLKTVKITRTPVTR